MPGIPDPDRIIAVSPCGRPDGRVVVAAARAGATGVLDLGTDEQRARAELDLIVTRCDEPFGVRLGPTAPTFDLPAAVTTVVVTDVDQLDGAAFEGRRVLAEVTSLDAAERAVAAGAGGVIAKGSEAGGVIGDEPAFVLLQRLVAALDVPIWVQGGIGVHTAAAAVAGGARGVVLDVQLALTRESTMPVLVQAAIRGMDGSETREVAGLRVYTRPDLPAPDPAADRAELVARLGADDLQAQLLPVGQDGSFASGLADRFVTVGGVVSAVDDAIVDHLAAAVEHDPLAPGQGIAASLSIERPIAQGPMTRVSDRPAFAAAVAQGGGLPFLALALMRGPEVRALLAEAHEVLAGRPWGVGILGFVPPELRDEQMAVLRELPPPVALIAGGRPSQAAPLEAEGVTTYLHVPSPGLLDRFLKDGARRFVFEGRECGGHVGPRTSFALWELQVERLLAEQDLSDVEVFFAGGIHDARSAAMVAAMAAPLVERGGRIGVLMGSAYVLTEEAVTAGAITPTFQAEAVACAHTVLLETSPGHATRCVRSPYVAAFDAERARLEAAGAPAKEMWAELEALNLGRLRIASKGVNREGDDLVEVDAEGQRREGMFMIGQVAALRDRVVTVDELHRDVSEGSTAHLHDLTRPGSRPITAGPARLDVAVIGTAGLFARAADLSAFWSNVVAGVDAVSEVPAERWSIDRYYTEGRGDGDRTPSKWGGFLPEVPFDPMAFGIPPRSVASIGQDQLLALQVAAAALADAGYATRPFDRSRTSVVFGAESGTDLANAYAFRANLAHYLGEVPDELLDRVPKMTEDSFPGVLANVVAGRIANRLDLRGTNYTVDAACGASMAAVQSACQELAAGSSDLVLCGGVDLHNGIYDYLLFAGVGALSPTGRCKTFDSSADGIALGEGVGCIVLKRLADAERDGDRILAVIEGVGASSDGRGLGMTAPRKEGQELALERAYAEAGASPASVGLVEAHGTGTVVGDRTEMATLAEVFEREGAEPASTTLGSVKSQIGHTKCAAGIAGIIKAVHALHRGVLPPTLHVTRPNDAWNEQKSPFVFNDVARPWIDEERRAGVSAFGFGGTNFHTVLAAYTRGDEPAHGLDEWPAELVLLRGSTPDDGRARARDLLALLDADDAAGRPWPLRDLAVTAAHGGRDAVQVAIVADDLDDLRARLTEVAAGDTTARTVFAAGGDGADASAPGSVAFLFPGQGSQRLHMLGDLFVAFPALRRYLRLGDPEWVEAMFPPAAFGDGRKAQTTRLTDTRVAQPALGMADLAMCDLLARCGVRPDLAGGHSYGELVALAAAGALSAEDLLALSARRGEAIIAAAGDDPGTMAAVRAGADAVRQVIEGWPSIVVANDNAPDQVVISGPTDDVLAAIEALGAAGHGAKRLPVACAFHTPTLAAARDELAAWLTEVDVAPPAIPVYANAGGGRYPDDPDGVRAELAGQVAAPVAFRDELEAMYADGARVFVEVGPGRVLTQLVGKTLGDRPHRAIATDASGEHGIRRFLLALAELAAAGVEVDTDPLFVGRTVKVVDASAVPAPAPFRFRGSLVLDQTGARVPGTLRPADEMTPLRLTGGSPAAPNGDASGAVTEYLRGLREIVAAERDVMLTYLGGADVSHRPVVAPLPATAVESATPAAVLSAPAPATEPSTALVPAVDGDALLATVVAIVSDRTGYPAEMLDPDLDLEAELSIDSIKRIEIIGELAERVGLPGMADGAVDESVVEELALVKTLRGIVDWIAEREPAAAGSTATAPITDVAAVTSTTTGVALDGDALLATVVAIVSDRTGYPAEMLDPDLDLEAELSIDSIKRIEIIGELAERVGLPGMADGAVDESVVEELALVKTLRGIVDWIDANDGTADADATAVAPAVEPAPSTATHEVPEGSLRYLPRLEPVEADQDLAALAGMEVFVVDDGLGVVDHLRDRLAEHGASLEVLAGDVPPGLGGKVVVDLSMLGGSDRSAIVPAFERLRAATTGGVAGVLTVSALGGTFGLGSPGAGSGEAGLGTGVETGLAALQAASGVHAMVRTAGLEVAGLWARNLDVDPVIGAEQVAALIVAELADRRRFSDIGFAGGERVALQWHPSASPDPADSPPAVTVDRESVIVVTGGARGIGGQVAVALARRSGCAIELVGRTSPAAEPEPDHVAGAADAAAIRRALIAADRSKRPAEIEAATQQVLARREVDATMAALEGAARSVRYHAVDVRDAGEVEKLLGDVRQRHGRIDGLVHAAGIREDKLIRDKEPSSFERVLATKAASVETLIDGLDADGFAVLFGSVAGVFGNTGQVDYAAANAVLDGTARAKAGGDRRVTSLDWGPWGGTGMVTAELARTYEARGVGLIDVADGIGRVLDELAHGLPDSTVVLMRATPDALTSHASDDQPVTTAP